MARLRDALLAVCLIGLWIGVMSAPAAAAPAIALASDVYVERSTASTARVLQPAQQLSSGDRIVTIVSWKRLSNGGQFTVTNPLPRTSIFRVAIARTRKFPSMAEKAGDGWERCASGIVSPRQKTLRTCAGR